jgi:hypothetical protein
MSIWQRLFGRQFDDNEDDDEELAASEALARVAEFGSAEEAIRSSGGLSDTEDFAGQISTRGVKWMLDHLGSVQTEIFQFLEPTHHVWPEQQFFIPNLLGEFKDPKIGIVHGQGGGHAFIRVDALRDIARTHSSQIHDYAALVYYHR